MNPSDNQNRIAHTKVILLLHRSIHDKAQSEKQHGIPFFTPTKNIVSTT